MDRNVVRPGERVEISWRLAVSGRLLLAVFNSAGELVRILFNQDVSEVLVYRITWDQTNERGRPVSSNVYVLRASGQGFAKSHKLGIVR